MFNMHSELDKCNDVDIRPLFNDETSDENRENILTSCRLKMKRWMFNDKMYKIIRYDK